MAMNNTPQKAAINSQIQDLVDKKYPSIRRDLQRGIAFNDLSASIMANADIQDEDITEGNDDNGIDCIYIVSSDDEKLIYIFSCKSSFSDDFSERDIKEFRNGLEYIFEKQEDAYSKLENKKLIAKIADIREEKEEISEINCFYCVFNGKNKSEKKISRIKAEIEEYFNNYLKSIYPNAKFSLKLISADDLYSSDIKRKETLRNKIVEISYFGDKVISSEVEINNVKGRLATVRGEDIAKSVKVYGEALFEKNIRGWMTFRKYNKDILTSCISKEDAELFWFLNNGITIVCEKCIPDPDKKVLKLTNPQIINGRQTAMVLSKAFDKKELKKSVKILLKIYETDDRDLILKVAKSTNSQLAVKSRDLVSNNPEQIALQNEFNRRNYFCERQRGENRPINKKFKYSFNNFFVAQSILSVILKKPCLAKRKQENILFGEPLYSQIFNRSFDEILAAVLLCDFCSKKGMTVMRKNKEEEIQYFAWLQIARVIWEKMGIPVKNSYKKIINILEGHNKNYIDDVYKKSVKTLNNILAEYDKKEKVLSVGHFFARLEIDNEIHKRLKK